MKIWSRLTRGAAAMVLLLFSLLIPGTGAAEGGPWRFVVMSDTRSNPCDADGKSGVNTRIVNRIATALAKEKPDVVLVPGDLVLGKAYQCGPAAPFATQLANWREAMKPVYEAGIPVLPVRGNHEYQSRNYFPNDPCRPLAPNPAALATYLAAFGRDVPQNGPDGQKGATYAYPHNNALFIGLDELFDLYSYDRAWLDAMLTANPRQHLFVFGHFPAFGVKHEDNLSCNGSSRDALWNAIGSHNGRMYFCGHDHLYDRSEVMDAAGNRVQQVLVGNGGAPFYNYTGGYDDKRVKPQKRVLSKPGYVVVTVDGTTVSVQMKAVDQDGTTIADEFGYTVPK
jgi:3',5'-cyclic AMP phosphodiesterase CpdA